MNSTVTRPSAKARGRSSGLFAFALPSRAELSALPRAIPRHAEPSLEISLIIPARHAGPTIEAVLAEAHRFLSRLEPGSFEILIVPNPRPGDISDDTDAAARRAAAAHPEIRVVPHLAPPGKGAALRTGFLQSRGRFILFTDADLPYDLEFFERALSKLRAGIAFVTGNRRLPSSHFDVPVSLLPLAYGRHRLGLLFNLAVRALFPIRTTDTQAGIKALRRELALEAFALQACPGFFFDLELFLTALRNAHAHEELPVTLHLNTEKSTVRLVKESILATFWLVRLMLRDRAGAYRADPRAPRLDVSERAPGESRP
ncbi:MAG: glycosyltransferase [Oligoflexia bacterium]|nr:glycosyltransferase [Oligoflexia bacterium]